ncbi:heme exporter protein CcmB [Malikia sp.]|uniref:heme exporter protein CcmB n=1 Tax=Malikia sp. TaxID=2070706 RepID=UPI002637B083|nr:heme exporter protein CcmB [Malikia sp.]MDD2730198.1 heme exporter protein CcmB [Malikia sp.]
MNAVAHRESRAWWPALRAVALREWQSAWRRPGDWVMHAMFFVMVSSLFPLSLNPEPATLVLLGPGVLWVGVCLAVLLATSRLFQDDLASGWLDHWVLSGVPLPLLLASRMVAQWLLAAAPVLLAVPLVGLQFGLSLAALVALLAALLLGSGVLVMLACVAAALGAGARGGALLTVLLVLPLAVPVLVFGTMAVHAAQRGSDPSAELALLGAMWAFAALVCPWVGGAAVSAAVEG